MFEIYEPSVKGNVVDWLNLAVKEIHSVWEENKIPHNKKKRQAQKLKKKKEEEFFRQLMMGNIPPTPRK